jgi:hypothetical protein
MLKALSHTFILAALLMAGCASQHRLDPEFYETFSEYEQRDIRKELESRGELALACDGHTEAVHRILLCAVGYGRDGGEKDEACTIRILTLLFHLGDDAFSQSLLGESSETREAVGERIDWAFVRHHLAFPKTRACYCYRGTSQ